MTYSIVGADTVTRQVGGAGTSCLGGQDVYIIYGGVPGYGVVHAQAQYSTAGRNRARMLLADGELPADIISAITAPAFDPQAGVRQYGIVDVAGNRAGFTGDDTMPFAEDRQGQSGPYVYSVQGNILTSAAVLDHAASAFEGGACDLAERLMSALEAGADGGEGDSRCTPDGIPSDSAFLQVEAPEGQPGDFLSLRVESSGNDSPLPPLREQLDAWRADHPCPVNQAGAGGAAGAAGSTGTAGTTSGAQAGGAASGSGGSTTGGMASATSAGSAGATSGSTGTTASEGNCGCRVPHGDSAGVSCLLLGFLLVVAWGRRRAARQLHPILAP